MPGTESQKTCRKCGEEKPLDDFYSGRARCKECHKAGVYAHREKHRDAINAKAREERAKDPERWREKERKWFAAHREEVNARRRELRAENPRYLEVQRAHYRANKEKIDAYRLAYVRANKERINAYQREWRRQNPERVKERTRRYNLERREWRRQYMRRYYLENTELFELHRRRRVMRLAGVESEDYSRKEIYERDDGKCRGCESELPCEPGGFAIDHIVPLSLDGPDTRANVQLMCPTCNRAKWANLEGQIHLPV